MDQICAAPRSYIEAFLQLYKPGEEELHQNVDGPPMKKRRREINPVEFVHLTGSELQAVHRVSDRHSQQCDTGSGGISESEIEYAIRKVQNNRACLELVYVGDVNMLGENPRTIGENMGILLEASKEIGLEVNPEKTKSLPSKETLRGHSDSSFRGEGYIQCCVDVRLCYMCSNQELAEIGRGGPIAWPPRSPDLNPLD
ncbi:hypothetical protein ANN_13664 [Periplaneta americana]|uniref:Reverse transcriptase domain-containing protein n=1 Tax=Periplaneta americana TaxID=6978 RepID=A0ABQ8TLS9_PERAM|nr:hypothetical protein ANN_13664 [Periplaneta americana]